MADWGILGINFTCFKVDKVEKHSSKSFRAKTSVNMMCFPARDLAQKVKLMFNLTMPTATLDAQF